MSEAPQKPEPQKAKPSPAGLRAARREQAKARNVVPIKANSAPVAPPKPGPPPGNAVAKAPAKAPAKKAAPVDTRPPRSATNPRFTRAKYKAKEGEKLYQASSRAGKINVRGSKEPMTHAIDVAQPTAPRPDQKAGLIWGFYASGDAANEAAKSLRDKGFDVRVVPATEYVPSPN